MIDIWVEGPTIAGIEGVQTAQRGRLDILRPLDLDHQRQRLSQLGLLGADIRSDLNSRPGWRDPQAEQEDGQPYPERPARPLPVLHRLSHNAALGLTKEFLGTQLFALGGVNQR